jgi:hypothetical protein
MAVVHVSREDEVPALVVHFEVVTLGQVTAMLAVVRVVAFCDDVQPCARTRYLGVGVEPLRDGSSLLGELTVALHVIQVEPDEGVVLGEAEGCLSTDSVNLCLCFGEAEQIRPIPPCYPAEFPPFKSGRADFYCERREQ